MRRVASSYLEVQTTVSPQVWRLWSAEVREFAVGNKDSIMGSMIDPNNLIKFICRCLVVHPGILLVRLRAQLVA